MGMPRLMCLLVAGLTLVGFASDYAAVVEKATAFFANDSAVKAFAENGVFPTNDCCGSSSKARSAIIRCALRAAAREPARADFFVKVAKGAAGTLVAYAQSADVGLAFLQLERATGEAKYLAAAESVGRACLKLLGGDGAPVAENSDIPVETLVFFEALAARTSDPVWLHAADRVFASLENGPVKTSDREGSSEGAALRKLSGNRHVRGCSLTAMYILRRFPGVPSRLEQAKDLLRLAEESRGRDASFGADTSTVALLYLAMYRATGEEGYLAKGRALMDSLARLQLPSGDLQTPCRNISGNDGDGRACFDRAIEALAAYAAEDPAAPKPARSFGPLLDGAKPTEVEYIWPEGRMPDVQPHQIAAKSEVAEGHGFNPDEWRRPFLEWYAPAADVKKDVCVITVSGGGFVRCGDARRLQPAIDRYVKLGVTVANLTYRTPLPDGLPMYQSGWEDLQRAVRVVRFEAAKRGYSPEKIGAHGIGAGGKAILLVATSSETRACAPVDAIDETPAHLNFAVPIAPAYTLTDGATGPNVRAGEVVDTKLVDELKFDAKTCPMCFVQGGADIFSPNGTAAVYAELRKRKIPAELHFYPDRSHDFQGDLNRTDRPEGHDRWFDRVAEFLTQMRFLGTLAPEVPLQDRYALDNPNMGQEHQDVWPAGRMPYPATNACTPFIEWHLPRYRTTKAIQIVYSGGAYVKNKPHGLGVAPLRRYLNDRGVTVVTLKYRAPRPLPESGLAKHTPAWADLQRAIRLVRSQAKARGLDPDRIGLMGMSAGGHLTLMGATTSVQPAYWPLGDEVDTYPCNVQWAIAIYPAYVLTDGLNGENATRGLGDDVRLVRDFAFDPKTCPILFLHGDADGYSPMGSVRVWEQLRRMGIQGELHTLATCGHTFQRKASPGTGGYTWMDRIWEFMNHLNIH